ncbi:MAG: ATP-dependent protease ATPase subunit HslU [Alphaproteobacteria bacterium]|nr:ATP-dependent protease ATPase subunit HslU [Alphaproteobacteria bacterium]
MTDLRPREIVAELDRHIVGQEKAKKAVSVALRNRWRRKQLQSPLREETLPKNILLIGPTGVGKTEIARRMAKLAGAPFIKVEATKFTEIGYVGRDVEQIIRDLLEVSISRVREKKRQKTKKRAEKTAEDIVISALAGKGSKSSTREHFLTRFRNRELDAVEIEIEIEEQSKMPGFEIPGMPGAQIGMINLGDMFGKTLNQNKKSQLINVRDGYEILIMQESEKLLDQEQLISEAIKLVEEEGIVFLDEIDKICVSNEQAGKGGGNVSREGVQRDLLPLIEGTTVSTRHGSVKSDHILFIASGAFHIAKPSDLLPELQGRLPIRIELHNLVRDDFIRILTEPEASLVKQYIALFKTENISLSFTKAAIEEIADTAVKINSIVENIGARRLHTVMEQILDEISFSASDRAGENIVIEAEDVLMRMDEFKKSADLSHFIL